MRVDATLTTCIALPDGTGYHGRQHRRRGLYVRRDPAGRFQL